MINERFKIVKKIGEGRSSVFLCLDSEFSDSECAVKILNPLADENEAQGFIKEYFTLLSLDHPNIITANELGTVVKVSGSDEISAGSPFIKMEYFPSDELLNSSLINDEQNLRKIIKQLCSALFYLHQSNYIYYDLKPENILISQINSEPVIKLIDLGLAEQNPSVNEYEVKGTAQYIAPELLKKEEHNHTADLYSLGMLLYRIIYNSFPFDYKDELEIYKAQIEEKFVFAESDAFSAELINAVKKLVKKNPGERYQNALALLEDLNIAIDSSITKDFIPAKVFSNREDAVTILKKYIDDKTSSEIFSVKGSEGSGKTSLAVELYRQNENSVLITETASKTGVGLIRFFLKKIFYSAYVYPLLNNDKKESIEEYLTAADDLLVDELPVIVNIIYSAGKPLLLIDDFNSADELAAELLDNLLKLIQTYEGKIILFESSDKQYASEKLNNLQSVTIGSFTDTQLTEFFKLCFAEFFPKKELHSLVIKYADLMPGNIISFIKDLIILNIMRFDGSGINFTDDENTLDVLQHAHFAVYDLRIKKISEEELHTAQVLSALEISVNLKTLAQIVHLSEEEIKIILQNLEVNNIIQPYYPESGMLITSDGLKKHIYNSIEDKNYFHSKLAESCEKLLPHFSRIELARQFELAEIYDMCYEVLQPEILNSEKHSTYTYSKKLMEYLINLPLNDEQKNKLKYKLADIHYRLGDYNSSLKTLNEIKSDNFSMQELNELKSLKAKALIGAGSIDEGISLLNDAIENTSEGVKKQELLVDLSYATFELNNYDDAYNKCKKLLQNYDLPYALKGRCFNLKGMYEIYKNNDFKTALVEFNKAAKNFEEANLPKRVAGVEVNVGNIYNILGNYKNAEEEWKKAEQINQSVGNLEQQGILYLNFGNFYFDRQKYEHAVESNKNAITIFQTLGQKINEGKALFNLAEVYLTTCEYQNSYDSIHRAIRIFKNGSDLEELSEALLMCGKLYFVIGYLKGLTDLNEKYNNLLDEFNLSEKQKINGKYLKVLLEITSDDGAFISSLENVSEAYKNLKERNYFAETHLLLIEKLIEQGKFEDAFNKFNSKEILDLCSQNNILGAQRDYFLGKISLRYASDKLSPPLEHFENAFDKMKDESISEITWKILLSLAENYSERGQFNKAKKYAVYARELLQFIAENIKSSELRTAYFKQPERENALNKINNIYRS